MKQFKTSTEDLLKIFRPDLSRFELTITPYYTHSQKQFNAYIEAQNLDIEGTISEQELSVISNIKKALDTSNTKHSEIQIERMEFDYAIIFHSELKKLGFSKFHIDDVGMWRWLSMNYFLKEVSVRRAQRLINKKEPEAAAKSIFTHMFGEKTRDIFPRRYFVIGERLYDKERGYALLQILADKSKLSKTGGFGNLINNLLETSLVSPNDFVSKVMSKILLTRDKLADDKEVARAFVRYNGFKKRLLNDSTEKIFEQEICLLNSKSSTIA